MNHPSTFNFYYIAAFVSSVTATAAAKTSSAASETAVAAR
jgi:hypothetical protein